MIWKFISWCNKFKYPAIASQQGHVAKNYYSHLKPSFFFFLLYVTTVQLSSWPPRYTSHFPHVISGNADRKLATRHVEGLKSTSFYPQAGNKLDVRDQSQRFAFFTAWQDVPVLTK